MNDIEQRLRDSLTARASDVEPTPELWREVDRRITRRRRVRVAAWSLAGAAAVAGAVFVIPGLVGTSIDIPEIEPIETPPTPSGDAADDETADDDTSEETAETDDPDTPTDQDPGLDDPTGTGSDLGETLLVGGAGDLRLIGPDGDQLLTSFAEEGESFVSGLAVRPGSTAEDLTAVVLTQAEGMWDLRTLRARAGEVSLEVFPEAYRPGRGGAPAGEGMAVRGPVWSPDGTSLAWLESGTGGSWLQTIGWSNGPGTGDTATDNAQWDVSEVVPPGSTPNDWITSGDGTWIRATMPDSTEGWYAIRLERQADDAWVLADLRVVPAEAEPSGNVVAVGGATAGDDDPDPRWLLRTTLDGVVLVDRSAEPASLVDLPTELLSSDGFAQLWLAPLSNERVVVGSASTSAAWVVAHDAEPNRLGGDVAYAAVVR